MHDGLQVVWLSERIDFTQRLLGEVLHSAFDHVLRLDLNVLVTIRSTSTRTRQHAQQRLLSPMTQDDVNQISPNFTWLVTSRLDTKLYTLDVSSPRILAMSSLSNCTARHARHVERVVSRRDEPSGIWAFTRHPFSDAQLIRIACCGQASFGINCSIWLRRQTVQYDVQNNKIFTI